MRHRSPCSTLLLPLLLSAPAALAQTAGSVGIGTTTPHPAAALDISSSGKGLLIPRLDSAQRAAIPAPPTGLMVFQTDGRQGFWYYGGGQWLYLPDKTRTGDNLGSHRATQNLDLGAHQLVGNGGPSGLAIDSTGRVGVGTPAPHTSLHVLSPTYDVATFTTNLGAGPHLLLERDSSHAVIDYIGLYTGNGEREGALELRGNTSVQISGDGDVSRPDLTVLANGDVGIGTNFPRQKLHVEGLLYTQGIRFPDNSLQITAATPDNLGNHTASQNLNLRRNLLTGGGAAGLAVDSVGRATATVQVQPVLRVIRPTTSNVKWPNELQIGLGSYGTSSNSQTRADFRLIDGASTTPDRTVLTLLGNGNVGIGTTEPQNPLHLVTGGYDVATLESGNVGPHLNLLKTGSGQATIDYIGTGVTNSYRDGALELRGNTAVQISGNNDASPELTVRANGNVGIGTPDPQQKLHVTGQVYSSTGGFRFPDNSVQTTAAAGDNLGNHRATRDLNLRRNLLTGGGGGGLALDSVGLATATVQTQPLLRLVRPTTTNVKWPNQLQIGLGSYGTAAESQTRADFTLSDGGTNTPDRTVLSLLANGNVGIGTTSPQNPLHVTTSGNDAATLESGGAGPHLNLVKTGGGKATIDYIGVGTSQGTREGTLELRGNTAVSISGNNDASPELTIRADGKVGVGTTDPQATLDVNGSVRLGPLGTPMRNVQSGIVNVGSSTGNTALVGLGFPHAFTTTPLVLVSVTAEDNTTLWDVFAASVRVVSPTQLYINVHRVDTTSGGWGQNVRVTWMAWEQ